MFLSSFDWLLVLLMEPFRRLLKKPWNEKTEVMGERAGGSPAACVLRCTAFADNTQLFTTKTRHRAQLSAFQFVNNSCLKPLGSKTKVIFFYHNWDN